MTRSRTGFPSWLLPPTAVLATLWVLLASALAVRPDLHELVCHHHEHDCAATHENAEGGEAEGCVITQFADSQILALDGSLPGCERVPFVVAGLLAWEGEAVTRDLCLPPGCGPPVA